MSFTTVRMTVGRVLLVAGVLVLLFIPYLLWGTGLETAHSQATLRNQFSQAERSTGTVIPHVHLRAPKVTAAANQPLEVAPPMAAPPVGSPIGNLSIPKIGLSMIVVEGTGDAQLAMGPGHYQGTPLPGEEGNVAIAGHRTTYLHPFYDLNQLVPGDPITITTLQGVFLYHVTTSQAVSPSDVQVVADTRSPELTLTTCTPPYSAAQRLVVHANLVASLLVDPKHQAGATSRRSTRAVIGGTGPTGNPGKKGKSGQPKTNSTAETGSSSRDWGTAIGWGIVVAALTIGLWIGVARTRSWRAAVLGFGLLTWLVVVFFFFQAVTPLLPASY